MMKILTFFLAVVLELVVLILMALTLAIYLEISLTLETFLAVVEELKEMVLQEDRILFKESALLLRKPYLVQRKK